MLEKALRQTRCRQELCSYGFACWPWGEEASQRCSAASSHSHICLFSNISCPAHPVYPATPRAGAQQQMSGIKTPRAGFVHVCHRDSTLQPTAYTTAREVCVSDFQVGMRMTNFICCIYCSLRAPWGELQHQIRKSWHILIDLAWTPAILESLKAVEKLCFK